MVRKRPLNQSEQTSGSYDVVTAVNPHTVCIHEPKKTVDMKQTVVNNDFVFDRVFHEESTNDEVLPPHSSAAHSQRCRCIKAQSVLWSTCCCAAVSTILLGYAVCLCIGWLTVTGSGDLLRVRPNRLRQDLHDDVNAPERFARHISAQTF